ncbi:Universal stress protein F [bacterium HR39]|nr:Universal stress protein F [bacterium HR39]
MKRYERIFWIFEDEPAVDAALRRAAVIARAFSGRLVLAALAGEGREDELTRRLAETAAVLDAGLVERTVVLPAGDADALLAELAGGRFDLVAKKASPDRTLGSYLLGTLDTFLIEHAPVPVLVEKPVPQERIAHVLVAVDLTDDAAHENLLLDHAVSLARALGARMSVLHVWHMESEEALRGRAFTAAAKRAIDEEKEAETRRRREALAAVVEPFREIGISIAVLVEEGPVATTIVEVGKREAADLIAIGTHVRSHVETLLLGSTAESVLRLVETNLLVVRPPA